MCWGVFNPPPRDCPKKRHLIPIIGDRRCCSVWEKESAVPLDDDARDKVWRFSRMIGRNLRGHDIDRKRNRVIGEARAAAEIG